MTYCAALEFTGNFLCQPDHLWSIRLLGLGLTRKMHLISAIFEPPLPMTQPMISLGTVISWVWCVFAPLPPPPPAAHKLFKTSTWMRFCLCQSESVSEVKVLGLSLRLALNPLCLLQKLSTPPSSVAFFRLANSSLILISLLATLGIYSRMV